MSQQSCCNVYRINSQSAFGFWSVVLVLRIEEVPCWHQFAQSLARLVSRPVSGIAVFWSYKHFTQDCPVEDLSRLCSHKDERNNLWRGVNSTHIRFCDAASLAIMEGSGAILKSSFLDTRPDKQKWIRGVVVGIITSTGPTSQTVGLPEFRSHQFVTCKRACKWTCKVTCELLLRRGPLHPSTLQVYKKTRGFPPQTGALRTCLQALVPIPRETSGEMWGFQYCSGSENRLWPTATLWHYSYTLS